jgi:hypothetical protein
MLVQLSQQRKLFLLKQSVISVKSQVCFRVCKASRSDHKNILNKNRNGFYYRPNRKKSRMYSNKTGALKLAQTMRGDVARRRRERLVAYWVGSGGS